MDKLLKAHMITMRHRFMHYLIFMSLGGLIGFHVGNNLDHIKNMLTPGRVIDDTRVALLHDDSFFSRCRSTSTESIPQPVILISKGRSGSSSTWQIMGNLTGFETNINIEYTGSYLTEQKEFFSRHKDDNWLVDLMCDRRRLFKNQAGIVGTKWKLTPELFHYAGVQETFRFIARNRQPGVKVIYSTRNVLDVHISEYKHSIAKLPAHCADDQCQKQVLQKATGLQLPTMGLVRALRKANRENADVERFLKRWKVPFVAVSYDKLYSGGDAAIAEWQRIFRFLGQGPADSLTLEQLQGAMQTEVTFVKQHSQSLANYDRVRKVLAGTEFEGLLH